MERRFLLFLLLAAGMLLLPASVPATHYNAVVTPGHGIKGTAHDLSRAGAAASGRGEQYGSNDTSNAYLPGGDLDRICIWCHAPHNTYRQGGGGEYGGSINYYPLWNHTVTGTFFTTYRNGPAGADSPSRSVVSSIPLSAELGQPGSVSKLCLSCHDGTVAVNEYGFTPGGTRSVGTRKGDAAVYINSQYRIGVDLRNHHPIGFNYAAVQALAGDLADPGTIMNGSATIADLLYDGRMECPTCHDVHNSKNVGEKFLWRSDRNSRLCLTCHLKDKREK